MESGALPLPGPVQAPRFAGALPLKTAYRRCLVVADVVVTVGVLELLIDRTGGSQATLALLLAIVLLTGKMAGLYDRDVLVLYRNTLDEAPKLGQLAAIAAIAAALTLPDPDLPTRVLFTWTLLFLALCGARSVARAVARGLARPERCLLLADSNMLPALALKLARNPSVTVVDQIPIDSSSADLLVDTLGTSIRRQRIERVLLAPRDADGEVLDMVRVARTAGTRVSVLPRLLQALGPGVQFDELDGIPMFALAPFGLSRWSRLVKRAFDVVVSSVCLIALAPLVLAVAAAVKLDSPGPVFFRQWRAGRGSRPFRIFKFRSMVCDAEEQKVLYLHLNETEGLFKITNDPRITRVGRLLRASCLDELPQLFNVWRGEMSLVGPRPLVLDEDAKVTGLDRLRLELTPGITGPWQIMGPVRVPLAEMVAIDCRYVAGWSLWGDVKILLRTIPYALCRRGL